MFIHVTFKSHSVKQCTCQHTKYHNTTNHSGYLPWLELTYMPQTILYQNIVIPMILPRIYSVSVSFFFRDKRYYFLFLDRCDTFISECINISIWSWAERKNILIPTRCANPCVNKSVIFYGYCSKWVVY